MNVEIGAEAALFPEKEYISGIFVAVHATILVLPPLEVTYDFNIRFTLGYFRVKSP